MDRRQCCRRHFLTWATPLQTHILRQRVRLRTVPTESRGEVELPACSWRSARSTNVWAKCRASPPPATRRQLHQLRFPCLWLAPAHALRLRDQVRAARLAALRAVRLDRHRLEAQRMERPPSPATPCRPANSRKHLLSPASNAAPPPPPTHARKRSAITLTCIRPRTSSVRSEPLRPYPLRCRKESGKTRASESRRAAET